MKWLADTSVWTRMGAPSVREAVRALLGVGVVGRCAMTDLELGFSARNGDEWDRIHTAAAAFEQVPVIAEDFERACRVQRLLATAGLRGRKVPDLLIAAAAERTGRTVLHYDHDFEHIAQVTEQPQQWIVPAGSVN